MRASMTYARRDIVESYVFWATTGDILLDRRDGSIKNNPPNIPTPASAYKALQGTWPPPQSESR